MLIMCPAKSVPNSPGFSVEPKNDENFSQGKPLQIDAEQPPEVIKYAKFTLKYAY